MKKIITFLLTLPFVFSAVLFNASCKDSSKNKESYSEGIVFDLLEDGTYSVTGIGSFTGTELIIPSKYNGAPVSLIGEGAFARCSSIVSAKIPNSLVKIGNSAFSDCTSLTSVTIGNNVISIGNGAFSRCSLLTSVILPNSVTWIGERAFASCSSLTAINIPDKVTYIGYDTFLSCDLLAYTEYGNAHYLGNDNNPYFWLIKAKDTSITSCTVNTNTKFICVKAFSSCKLLTDVAFESADTWSIGEVTEREKYTIENTSDRSQNATYLTDTYANYYWKRK